MIKTQQLMEVNCASVGLHFKDYYFFKVSFILCGYTFLIYYTLYYSFFFFFFFFTGH